MIIIEPTWFFVIFLFCYKNTFPALAAWKNAIKTAFLCKLFGVIVILIQIDFFLGKIVILFIGSCIIYMIHALLTSRQHFFCFSSKYKFYYFIISYIDSQECLFIVYSNQKQCGSYTFLNRYEIWSVLLGYRTLGYKGVKHVASINIKNN